MKATEAIKNRPLSSEEYRKLLEEYQEASKPFIKILASVLATEIPKMILLPNGKLEAKHSDLFHATKKRVDETLDLLWKNIVGTPNRL